MRRTRAWLAAVAVGAAGLAGGCGGGGGQDPAANVQQQTQEKLDAMKQLAEAVEKKDQQQISGCIETLIAANMDVKGNPAAAKELVDVYTKRVKGKLRGDDGNTVKGIVDDIEKQLK